MNTLLVFFAIPLATIILSAIFETWINHPVKVAGIFFSIFIVVAFALGGTAELVLLAIIYTAISFLTALIVHMITHHHRCENNVVETQNVNNCYLEDSSNLMTSTVDNSENYIDNTQLENNVNAYNNSRCIKKYR